MEIIERSFVIFGQLNDVEQGGATVFPDIDVTVWPKKGSAVFWYNLYKSGEGDARMKHGACPVLVGSKWSKAIIVGPRWPDGFIFSIFRIFSSFLLSTLLGRVSWTFVTPSGFCKICFLLVFLQS